MRSAAEPAIIFTVLTVIRAKPPPFVSLPQGPERMCPVAPILITFPGTQPRVVISRPSGRKQRLSRHKMHIASRLEGVSSTLENLTICIPTFDRAKFVTACIDQLVSQEVDSLKV